MNNREENPQSRAPDYREDRELKNERGKDEEREG